MAETSRPVPAGDRLAADSVGRADTALPSLAAVTVALIAVQFALAGFGAFTVVAAPADHAYGPHEVLGLVICALAGGLAVAAGRRRAAARRQAAAPERAGRPG